MFLTGTGEVASYPTVTQAQDYMADAERVADAKELEARAAA